MIERIHHIIAIASAKGGVGKSMVAANLALAMQQLGFQVGLLDADIYGPSQAKIFGINTQQQLIQQQVPALTTIKKYGITLMSVAFMIAIDSPIIWRGPMVSAAFRQLLTQTSWGELDYLFIDLPPGTGDIHLSLVQNAVLSGAVMVSTPQEMALLDARKGIEMFNKVNVPILGIVENMSYYQCPHCHIKEDIFAQGGGDKLAQQYQVPLLGKLPLLRSIRIDHDQGKPTVIAQPQSEITQSFIAMARQIEQTIVNQTPQQQPSITFS